MLIYKNVDFALVYFIQLNKELDLDLFKERTDDEEELNPAANWLGNQNKRYPPKTVQRIIYKYFSGTSVSVG